MLPDVKLLWVVCEDGDEYLDRFARFLGREFRFVGVKDAEALCAALAAGADGVILDLDFSRAPPERLVGLPGEDRRAAAATQGIRILRHVRERGFATPVLLCADIDDPHQVAHIERTLAPVDVVPSHESLAQTAARMRARGRKEPK